MLTGHANTPVWQKACWCSHADRSDFITESTENTEIMDTRGLRRPIDGNRCLLGMAVMTERVISRCSRCHLW
jgi:hypothetical protein